MKHWQTLEVKEHREFLLVELAGNDRCTSGKSGEIKARGLTNHRRRLCCQVWNRSCQTIQTKVDTSDWRELARIARHIMHVGEPGMQRLFQKLVEMTR